MPFVPILLEPILIPLLTLMLAVLMWAMRRALFHLIQSAIDALHTGVPGLSYIAGKLRSGLNWILHYVENETAKVAIAVEGRTIGFFDALTAFVHYVFSTAHVVAFWTRKTFEALRHVVIPQLIRAGTHALWKSLHGVHVAIRALDREIERGLTHSLRAAKAFARAVAVELALPLHGLERELRRDGRALDRLYKRTRRLHRAIGIGAFTALLVTALARLGLKWLRCSNNKHLAKSLCRMPRGFLDDLLSLVADFFILTNICRVLPWLEEAFATVAAPLIGVLTKVGAGLCSDSAGPSPVMDVPPLSLPPVSGVTLYLP